MKRTIAIITVLVFLLGATAPYAYSSWFSEGSTPSFTDYNPAVEQYAERISLKKKLLTKMHKLKKDIENLLSNLNLGSKSSISKSDKKLDIDSPEKNATLGVMYGSKALNRNQAYIAKTDFADTMDVLDAKTYHMGTATKLDRGNMHLVKVNGAGNPVFINPIGTPVIPDPVIPIVPVVPVIPDPVIPIVPVVPDPISHIGETSAPAEPEKENDLFKELYSYGPEWGDLVNADTDLWMELIHHDVNSVMDFAKELICQGMDSERINQILQEKFL